MSWFCVTRISGWYDPTVAVDTGEVGVGKGVPVVVVVVMVVVVVAVGVIGTVPVATAGLWVLLPKTSKVPAKPATTSAIKSTATIERMWENLLRGDGS